LNGDSTTGAQIPDDPEKAGEALRFAFLGGSDEQQTQNRFMGKKLLS